MNTHGEDEICVIQNDYDDPFNADRVTFYDIGAWPTVVSNGVTDAWPLDCLEGDYQANAAIPSPLTLSITENAVGDFTVRITAEEDVIDADFFMVATLAEDVPSSGGTSYLPHHVKVHMTPPLTGDPFTLMAGEEAEIHHAFVVQPEWEYELMGVAAWVSRPGGTSVSPCTGGFPIIMNEVLQSRWVPTTMGTSAVEEIAGAAIEAPTLRVFPNPGIGSRTITYSLPHAGPVHLGLYDAQGRLVERLNVPGRAGTHSIAWSPLTDGAGARRSHAGVRFVRLDFGGEVLTKEILQIR